MILLILFSIITFLLLKTYIYSKEITIPFYDVNETYSVYNDGDSYNYIRSQFFNLLNTNYYLAENNKSAYVNPNNGVRYFIY